MDGKVWVYGGWMSAATSGTQQFDVYDVASNKWTTLGYGPVPHTHAGVAGDPANHVIYYAGGYFGNYPGILSNGAWKYTVALDGGGGGGERGLGYERGRRALHAHGDVRRSGDRRRCERERRDDPGEHAGYC